MRIFSCLVIAVCALNLPLHAATPAAIAKAELAKLDVKIRKLNLELQPLFKKSLEYENTVIRLRERCNEAKNPESRARFEKALARNEDLQRDFEALYQSKRQELAELNTQRRVIAGTYTGETKEERTARLGLSDGEWNKRWAAAEQKAEARQKRPEVWTDDLDADDNDGGVVVDLKDVADAAKTAVKAIKNALDDDKDGRKGRGKK